MRKKVLFLPGAGGIEDLLKSLAKGWKKYLQFVSQEQTLI
jgi:hypothetical protein